MARLGERWTGDAAWNDADWVRERRRRGGGGRGRELLGGGSSRSVSLELIRKASSAVM